MRMEYKKSQHEAGLLRKTISRLYAPDAEGQTATLSVFRIARNRCIDGNHHSFEK